MSVTTTYRSLDARQKALMKDKKIQASMILAEWIPFLGAVAKCDRIGDGRRKLFGWLAILSIIACIVLWIALEDDFPLLSWIAPVVFAVIWWRIRSIDIPPVLDQFVLPWLVLLKEDVAKDTKVLLKLDLSGPEQSGKRLSGKNLQGIQDSPHGCKDEYFRDPWLSGAANLADGNVLRWGVSDFVRKRVKTRRNARGKTKQKTKYKVQHNFDVHLTARAKDYQVGQATSNKAFRSSIKRGEKRTAVRVRSRSVAKELEMPPPLATLVETIARAYAHLSVPELKKERT